MSPLGPRYERSVDVKPFKRSPSELLRFAAGRLQVVYGESPFTDYITAMGEAADALENPTDADGGLVAFLYVLTRDHVTSGQIESILDDCVRHGRTPTFSSPQLESLAREWAATLRGVREG